MKIRIALILVLVALAAATLPAGTSARSDAAPTAVVGKWSRTVTQADVRRRGPAATGLWRLELQAVGTMRLFNATSRKAVATGRVATAGAGTLRMLTLLVVGGGRCAKEEEATYRYRLTSGRLVLTTSADKCPARDTVLVGTWRRS